MLVAHEGRRLVGSTVIYFVDTRSEEDTDIQEIVGPGSVGPMFTKASYDWDSHAIVMDSFWVAPDRRRAGVATAMIEQVAAIGLPAWGEFRDPWFGAFCLHRWPPTSPIRHGRYWPLYKAYTDATDWIDDEIPERVELDVTLWLSEHELTEMSEMIETSEGAVEFLGNAMDPHHDVRGETGGWRLGTGCPERHNRSGERRSAPLRPCERYLPDQAAVRASGTGGLPAFPLRRPAEDRHARADTRRDRHRSCPTQAGPWPWTR